MSPITDLTIADDVTVDLVKHNVSDHDVLWAARVSTVGEISHDETTEKTHVLTDRNKGLVNFLMRDRHGTPFEHGSMTFFIKAPIMVFREFQRHRVGWSYNEESGRYKELAPEFYIPGAERPLVQVGKAGRYQYAYGTPDQYAVVTQELTTAYEVAWESYQRMLRAGVAREVARLCLPVGVLSSMYATCNARSLMHFLGLRTQHEESRFPSFPQREIQMVADKMEATWADLMPVTHEAFNRNGRVAP